VHPNVFGVQNPHDRWKKVYLTRGAATQAMFRGYLAAWRQQLDYFFAAKPAEKKQIVAAAGWRVIEYRLTACGKQEAARLTEAEVEGGGKVESFEEEPKGQHWGE
jgi:hypothetical protein